jgi:hypothetical protein
MLVSQEVIVFDTNSEYDLADVRIQVRSWITDPYSRMPEQDLYLTRKGIVDLMNALQSALELLGQDFIVHHDGSISITIDDGKKLVDTQYVNLADYKNGIVAE